MRAATDIAQGADCLDEEGTIVLPLPVFPRRTVQPRDATRNAFFGLWPHVRVRVPSRPLSDDAFRVDVEPAVCVRHVLRERHVLRSLRLPRNMW